MNLPPPKKLRIVYAEDNLPEQEMMARILSNRGHEIVCFDNGRPALEAILSQPFDVLITDNEMPQMNGLTLVQELRRIESPLKIVVTSGFLETEVEERYRALGVKLFLPKPSPDEMILKVVEG